MYLHFRQRTGYWKKCLVEQVYVIIDHLHEFFLSEIISKILILKLLIEVPIKEL